MKIVFSWFLRILPTCNRTIGKAALVGIQVELEFRKESYRSKASFLDLEDMPVYDPSDEEQHIFSRKRILFCV